MSKIDQYIVIIFKLRGGEDNLRVAAITENYFLGTALSFLPTGNVKMFRNLSLTYFVII